MKNWILCGLSATLFLLAGCGGNPTQTAQNEPTAEQTAPAPVVAPEPEAEGVAPQKKEVAAPPADSILPPTPTDGAQGQGSSGIPKTSKPSKVVPAPNPTSVAPKRFVAGLDASKWTDLAMLDSTIVIDIKYATEDNFTKSKIYDCARCFLRPEAAMAIAQAQEKLKSRGYRLKMFDCYRPRPYQQRLWDKVPNPNYVTPPQKGSMHSRGAAVDLTIVDKKGKELDMGTPYDFFGEKAHADFTNLPEKILDNRKLLKKTLESVGFNGIRTEWWHFSYGKKSYDLSSELWECK